ncbi:hypothetical protein HKBW3S25_00780, partial [Candidatus Hakubella thermalkaliphila]
PMHRGAPRRMKIGLFSREVKNMPILIIILGVLGVIAGIITWILAACIIPGQAAGPFPPIGLIVLGIGLVLVGLQLKKSPAQKK